MTTIPEIVQLDKTKPSPEYFCRLRFGGGLATHPSIADVDYREATDGENFDIAIDRSTLKRRSPFDLVSAAPNGLEIRGYVELIKRDGTVTLLVQAGGTVYSWDGDATYTMVGLISANARIRGGRYSTDSVNDKVIITDLEKVNPVSTWDGTTFTTLTTNLGTAFYAKYCYVDNERALYGNVRTTTDTPHIMVGSKRGDFGNLTVTNRPASGLSDEDPFFIPMPDLKPINGLVAAFGQTVFSTETGQIWIMTGSTAKDFAIDSLFRDSAAQGSEAIINTQNDILYGRAGRIESLIGILAYGNVLSDDVTRDIQNLVSPVTGWTGVYNPRTYRGYWWAEDGNEVYVYNQQVYDPRKRTVTDRGNSPWSKWTTTYGNADFRQNAVALLRRPADGLDLVYFGDLSGNSFIMEGVGGQDGGSATVSARWRSGLFPGPVGAGTFDIKVTLWYAQQFAADVVVRALFHGETAYDSQDAQITIAALTGGSYFGGGAYWGGGSYFGIQYAGRFIYQPAALAGRSGAFQIEIEASSDSGFEFQYADIRYSASS